MFYPDWLRNDYKWIPLYVNVAPPSSSVPIMKHIGYYVYSSTINRLNKTFHEDNKNDC